MLALRLKPSRTLVAAFSAMLLASLQGAFLASGLGTAGIAALELVAGVGVALFFTLWDSTVQEQVPRRRPPASPHTTGPRPSG